VCCDEPYLQKKDDLLSSSTAGFLIMWKRDNLPVEIKRRCRLVVIPLNGIQPLSGAYRRLSPSDLFFKFSV
jgi:hypothetical protein